MVDASGIPRRVTPQTQAQKHNDLARTVEQQGSARRLESASIGKGGLTIRDGGKLVVDGDAQINGTLSLPKGIIDNDALAAPVTGAVYNASAERFNLAPSTAELLSVKVAVPEGFSRAMVQATSDMNFLNTGTTTGSSNLVIRIDGERAPLSRSSNTAEPRELTYVGCMFSRVVTTTGSFMVSCEGSSAGDAWYSTGDEGISLNVMVTFLR